MSLRSALVTGASGFLGAHLVRALVGRGAEVHAVTRRDPASAAAASSHPSDGIAVRWWRADLTEAESVARLIGETEPEVIFHLASLVSGRRDLELVLPAFADNLATTVNLMTGAATSGGCRRFVLAGSMEEPDLASGEAPSSPYSVAKGAASLYARFFHALYDLPVVQARIFMVYGPGQRDRSKVVPYSILRALAGEAPELSSGVRAVDWIYVDDVVSGLLALAETKGIEGETFDLGSGDLVTVREIVERICTAVGSPAPKIGAIADRPLEATRRADVTRSASRLGWRPVVTLNEGIGRTIEALRRERTERAT